MKKCVTVYLAIACIINSIAIASTKNDKNIIKQTYLQQEETITNKIKDLDNKIDSIQRKIDKDILLNDIILGFKYAIFSILGIKTGCEHCNHTCSKKHEQTYDEKMLHKYSLKRFRLNNQLNLIRANREWAQLECKD
ncbi:MAG TPA: hypothetical protein VGW78_00175 [Candidatus Babeliales bacterium]|jgi:hypothetical protein|nr:hypothetical protein [Candidatus Babeliales bacterium]